MFLKRWINNENNTMRAARQRGNAIVMLFAAIGMAGVVTYGLNNVMRGPATMTSEISRKTIAENTLIASTRLAIAAAANQPEKGDCDRDGFVEPIPFRDAGTAPAPTGGGLIPMTIGASLSDPWSTQYGYCVWDPGTLRVSDNVAACGGNTAKRLEGSKRDDQPAIAIISAGPNGAFETTCAAFVDTTPVDNVPDTPMISKPANSDDIVLSYTYAEANGIGGGMWKLKIDPLNLADKSTAEIAQDISIKGGSGGTFSGAVELKNKGLRLPGDPGDNSVTGPCVESKSNEMRTNISTTPPSLEICDFPNGNGWVPIGGGAEKFDPNKSNCTASNDGPFVKVASLSKYYMGNNLWTRAGKTGQQHVYVADDDKNVGVYSFDGSAFSYITGDSLVGPGGNIWGDQNYVYATSNTNGQLSAYSFDGTTLTTKATAALSSAYSAKSTWSDGAGKIYVSRFDGTVSKYRIYAYSFDGTTLTQLGVTAALTLVPDRIVGRGSTIFASGTGATPKLQIFNFDGTNFIQLYSSNTIGSQSIWVEKDYIYIPVGGGPIKAYTFDGTSLTEVGSYSGGTGSILGVWGDGSHLFVGRWGNGIEALKFNGTTFSSSGSFPTGDYQRFWGDGNYLYVTDDTGLHAFSGFECTSPNPGGGALPPPIPETPIDTTAIPDPLDTGLVSYWKMDDGTGLTVKDSVGTNNGTIAGIVTTTPKWTGGAKGTGGLAFQNTNNDAVKIPGLLGMPSAGTIAMWVNATLPNPDDPQGQTTLFSMGDHVILLNSEAAGLRLAYYTGSTWEEIQSYVNIRETGWQYVVATFDDANDLYRIYLNGILIKEAELTAPVAWTGLGADTWLGRHGDADGTVDFDGGLDDVRFYNRALSPDEVSRLTQRSKREATAVSSSQIFAGIAANRNKISMGGDAFGCGIKPDSTLWCWGGAIFNSSVSKIMYDVIPGGGQQTISTVPLRMRDTIQDYYYFLIDTASDIPNGKAMGLIGGVGQNVTVGAADTLSTSFYTPQGSPSGFAAGPVSIFFNFSAGASINLNGSVYLQRVSSAGVPKSVEKQIGTETVLATNKTYAWYGETDLGTWQAGDRLKVTLRLRNAGSTTTVGIGSGTWSTIRFATSETNLPGWAQVSTGTRHSCGIRLDGEAWCWGIASNALGTASPGTGLTPVKVSEPGPWTDIDSGDGFSCGLKSSGEVWCWGVSTGYRTGNGTSNAGGHAPSLISGTSKYVDIDVSSTYGCGIQAGGSLWCWGDDSLGQQGNGDATTANQTVPAEIIEKGPWASVSVGPRAACAIKKDGTAWCWGDDAGGSLGNGPEASTTQTRPVQVADAGPWGAISVGAGSGGGVTQRDTVCGIKLDGSVWCWGGNSAGAVGNGTFGNNVSTPVRAFLPAGAVAISNGTTNSCATLTDKTVWCWGYGGGGGLGNGSTSNSPYPVPLKGFSNPPAWEYNDDSTHIMPSLNAGIALRESWMSDDGTARGFGFTSPGSATLLHTDNTQMLLDSAGSNTSSQVSFSTTPTAGYADVTSGLTGQWSFEQTTGTVATATVGTQGVINSAGSGAIKWTPGFGKIGGGVYLSGNMNTNSFIAVNRFAAIETAAISVAFWMNRGVDDGGISTIIAKAHTNNTGVIAKSYAVGLDESSASRLTFTTGNTGGNDVLLSNRSIPAGQWVHVVATYNPTGGAPQKRIYINGVLDAEKVRTNAIVYTANATGNLFFGQGGCSAGLTCERYEGFLDETRIYNRALSEAEVASLYASQNAASQTPRSIGIDSSTNNLEMGVNAAGATDWMNTINGQLQVTSAGNVQIGTNTAPASMLSVEGAVRIGSQTTCAAANAGTIRHTGGMPAWDYCNGTAWTAFPSVPAPPWRRSKESLSVYQAAVIALKADGTAWGWGNHYALPMDEQAGFLTKPAQFISETNDTGWNDWRVVTMGSTPHGCGIRTDGSAWCWGQEAIGNNTANTIRRPTRVHTNAAAGGWFDWIDISSGAAHNCGIRANGTAWCWGRDGGGNPVGQLGDGTTTIRLRPVQVHNNINSTGWTDWVSISSGYNWSCGIRSNGTAWCWGSNLNGQLGDGTTTARIRPVQVLSDGVLPPWSDWVSISAGSSGTTCGIRSNGTAWCWGGNAKGVIGDGTTAPKSYPVEVNTDVGLPGWSDWVYIGRPSYYLTCGIRANGTAWCWGDGAEFNNIGNNSAAFFTRPTPVLNSTGGPGWEDWTTIDTYSGTTCGVRANGTLWCWGVPYQGILGNGQSAVASPYPTQVLNK